MRCLVEIEYGETIGHFVEILFGLAKGFLKLNSKQNQADLDPRSVPAGAVRRSGYLWVVNVLFDEISTLPCEPSERCHIARRRSFPGQCDGISPRERLKPSSVEGKTRQAVYNLLSWVRDNDDQDVNDLMQELDHLFVHVQS